MDARNWQDDLAWRAKADLSDSIIRKSYLRDLPPLEDIDHEPEKDHEPEVIKGLVMEGGKLKEVRIPGTNLDKRVIRFTLSTEKMDRQGDTVKASGWKLDEYAKNGVVLWSHQNVMLPVAKSVGIGVQGKRLVMAAQYAEHQLAEDVFQLYAGDFLRSYSPGFQPLKWKVRESPAGFDFEEQQLLEASCCNVPANPEALVMQASQGLLSKEVAETLDLRKELGERLDKIERKLTEVMPSGAAPSMDDIDAAALAKERIKAWLDQ